MAEPEQSQQAQISACYELHRRHADQVLSVWSQKYAEHKTSLARGTLPERCLLRLIPAERKAPVERAARWIAETLGAGVPRVFQHTVPNNERAVQDAVDGVLAGHEEQFRREHPTIRFATKIFTPDFSPTLQELSVEIKYPTDTRPPTAIINEMAATAAAHRKVERSILFVVYDYHRKITNQAELKNDLERNETPYVFVTVIR